MTKKTRNNLITSIVALLLSIAVAIQVVFAWFASNKKVSGDGLNFSVRDVENESNISNIRVNGKDKNEEEEYIIQPGEYYYFELEVEKPTANTTFTATISNVTFPEELDENLEGDKLTPLSCVTAFQFGFSTVPKGENEKNSALWEKTTTNKGKFTENTAEEEWTWTLPNVTTMTEKKTVYALLYFDPTVTSLLTDNAEIENSNNFFGQTFVISFKCPVNKTV